VALVPAAEGHGVKGEGKVVLEKLGGQGAEVPVLDPRLTRYLVADDDEEVHDVRDRTEQHPLTVRRLSRRNSTQAVAARLDGQLAAVHLDHA
jgi:hypothetical protein